MIQLAQFGAIVRYETIMHWRRRAWLGMVLGLIAMPIILLLVFGDAAEAQRLWAAASGLPTQTVSELNTITVTMYTAMPLYVITLLMIPVLAAEVIPHDRQVKVRELLDGLPISTGIYLAGKLFGYWLSVAIGSGAAMLIVGVTLYLLKGAFAFGDYISLWVEMILGIGLINSGLSLLLAAGQPTRRRALTIGIVFVVMCMFGNLGEQSRQYNTVVAYLNPGRPVITGYLLLSKWIPESILHVSRQDMYGAIFVGLLQVAVVGLIVGLWMRRSTARD